MNDIQYKIGIALIILFTICFIVFGILMVTNSLTTEQDYCNCVNSMPYMVTRMSEGKCLVSVFDPEAYHDASNLTVYQFLVMEHCR